MNWNEIKHFKSQEFDSPDKPGSGEHMVEGIVRLLDEIREGRQAPVIINSGYRTIVHNREVGGKESSSHLYGYAADLSALGSRNRYHLLRLAFHVGITRIGIARSFLHLDTDPEKPQDVAWLYGTQEEQNR